MEFKLKTFGKKIALPAALLLATTTMLAASPAQAADIANPQGVLLDTVTATITATPDFLDLNNSPSWVSDGNLATLSQCAFSTDGGSRVYKALNLKITKAGHYTFRIVGTAPAYNGDINESPIQDPFMALYKGFDPLHLDQNVVGCNDDEYDTVNPAWVNGDTFPTNGESNTNDRWSNFESDLTPGNYTVILTTYNQVTSAAWSPVAPQSATFEYWGPECGIETVACAASTTPVTKPTKAPTLAHTGSVTSPVVPVGFGLVFAGLVIARATRRKKSN